jgi:hemolysin III
MKFLYAYDNEPMAALTHFAGFLLAVAGLIVLVTFAALRGTVWHVVGFAIFGASMVLLYTASTLYHFIPITSKAKKIMQRVDHAMIYVLIAGTYTPICIITLRGAWGWSLFGVIWGLAVVGIVWKSLGIVKDKWLSTLFYLLMGWLAVIALVPLSQTLPPAGLYWLFAGGILYTLGAVAFAFSHVKFHHKWFGMHEVWHLFVMAGNAAHFWMLFRYVL